MYGLSPAMKAPRLTEADLRVAILPGRVTYVEAGEIARFIRGEAGVEAVPEIDWLAINREFS